MAPIALWILAGMSFALALHAFITYPLSLVVLRACRGRNADSRKWSRPLAPTRFAICTYVNDAVGLTPEKLRNLIALRAGRPQVQLLIYAEGEPRGLRDMLAPHVGCVECHSSPLMRGMSHAMNSLANRTRADVLVFADARAMLDEALLDKLDTHFSDRAVGCVCAAFDPVAVGDTPWSVASLYRRFDAWIRSLETDTGSTMGADGALFAVRAALYHPAPVNALHDMYVSLMVLCGGHRVVCAPDLCARVATPGARRSAFKDHCDVAYRALCVHRRLWSMLVRLDGLSLYQYVSHKLLRWFSAYLLATAIVCFVMAEAMSSQFEPLAMLGGASIAVWLLGHRLQVPPFAQASEVVSALTGAGLGAARALLKSE